jgi:hypothetical protein
MLNPPLVMGSFIYFTVKTNSLLFYTAPGRLMCKTHRVFLLIHTIPTFLLVLLNQLPKFTSIPFFLLYQLMKLAQTRYTVSVALKQCGSAVPVVGLYEKLAIRCSFLRS